MKKDIYKITNLANGKIYIGQSVCTKHRWEQHVSAARRNPKYPIDRAIAKYGLSSFEVTIIEKQIENYDEREQYWIQHYNCCVPRGYNIVIGGRSSGVGIDYPCSKIRTQEDIDNIIDLIRNSNFNFGTIGKQYGVSPAVISSINLGNAYPQEGIEYPIRLKNYSDDLLKRLTYSLKYELDKTMSDLAAEYHIDKSEISAINDGRVRYRSYLQYPLRSGKIYNPGLRFIKEIIEDLKEDKMSQTEIAKKYNVSKNCITMINYGKSYRQQGVEYPIRKKAILPRKPNKSFSPDELEEIEKQIRDTDMSFNAIALKHESSPSLIDMINSGAIKKYRKEGTKYPLRKRSAHSVSTIRV